MVNWCYLCKKAAESCNHILLLCPLAYELWTIVYALTEINWVMVGTIKDETWVWEGICNKREFVKLILLTILLVI